MNCPCYNGAIPAPNTRCFHCSDVIESPSDHVKHRIAHHSGPEMRAASTLAVKIYKQEAEDFKDAAISWIKSSKVTRWEERKVSLSEIDFSNVKNWQASKDPDRVDKFVKLIKEEGYDKPVLLVKRPAHNKLMVVDGHHRVLAWKKLSKPVPAFVGYLTQEHGPWDKMHNMQGNKKSG